MIDYPTNVPSPLITYSPRITEGLSYRLQMASGRSRQGMKTIAESHDVSLIWSLTQQQYSLFMGWWRDSLEKGSKPFSIHLISGASVTRHKVTLLGGKVSPSYDGVRWRVTGSAQLYDIIDPIPLPPPEIFTNELLSSSTTSASYSVRRTVMYYDWSVPREQWGSTAMALSDNIVDVEGTPTDTGEASLTSSAGDFTYTIKRTVVRLDGIADSLSSSLHDASSSGGRTIFSHDNEVGDLPTSDLTNLIYTYEKET